MRHSDQVKRAARARAHRYLRRGIIDRRPCERCGDPVAEMHHSDYRQPWLVVWLCRHHHHLEHTTSHDHGQLLLWLGA